MNSQDKVRAVHVRPARAEDLPSILAIYNDAVLHTTASAEYEPRSLESGRQWFEEHVRDGYPILVAEAEDGQVVGWSSLSRFQERVGYRFTAETSVYIASEWRGLGLGAQLMTPLLKAAREREFHALIAKIAADNEASLRLHASLGFTEVGRLKQVVYKFGRWLDIVYMERVTEDGGR